MLVLFVSYSDSLCLLPKCFLQAPPGKANNLSFRPRMVREQFGKNLYIPYDIHFFALLKIRRNRLSALPVPLKGLIARHGRIVPLWNGHADSNIVGSTIEMPSRYVPYKGCIQAPTKEIVQSVAQRWFDSSYFSLTFRAFKS